MIYTLLKENAASETYTHIIDSKREIKQLSGVHRPELAKGENIYEK